ncbi:MAG: hypothetical protein H6667_22310 [Ardenticatenaceae bacterium]|nr:hypothetical protein [Ardenticatenaceae bacterium]MCB9444828.1 hypothetical protein [Ardenticatenaceae bacterium]
MRKAVFILLILTIIMVCLCGWSLYSAAQAGSMVQPTRRPSVTPPPRPQNQADCQAAGGDWAPFGMESTMLCNMPTTDAGMTCTDSSECEGNCLATDLNLLTSGYWSYLIGECSPTQINFSGMYIEDGRLFVINAD